MLRAERQVYAVLCCRSLKLEVEAAAEALAQRQAPGPVRPTAEGSMQDELHSPALIKETFGDYTSVRRDGAENALPLGDVRPGCGSGLVRESRIVGEPAEAAGPVMEAIGDCLSHSRHARGELARSRRRLPDPEGDIGRLSPGVFNEYSPALDLPDPPG